MVGFDPGKSDFGNATRNERIFLIVLLVSVPGAVIPLVDGEPRRARWVAGAVVAMTLVLFVPARRCRLIVMLAATGLMVITFTTG